MLAETIISHMIHDEEYCRKIFPYIEVEYFDTNSHRKIFETLKTYIDKYKEPPTTQALEIMLENRNDLSQNDYKEIGETLQKLKYDKNTNKDWLISETEKYCQDMAFYNALKLCVQLKDGSNTNMDKSLAPEIMTKALGVNFDTHIGHDFFEDSDSRYDSYHKIEERVPFDIEILNKITRGGLPKKSLTCYLAETGVGKTIVMCHQAAHHLMIGKNVLYITLEMAEEKISERIDANTLDITIDDLKKLSKEEYNRKIFRIKNKTSGKLIVKEYPTGSASVNNFRHLLNELKLKKKFIPDIIYIDYINLCASSRVKNTNANSYTIVKSIAEEIRGLAMEFSLPIVTATQANRQGYSNSDLDITNTSESMGLPATLDCFIALISTEELAEMGQLMMKQLKNRWGDLNYYKRFVVGIDKPKMKLYDLEETAQKSVFNEPKTVDKIQKAESKFSFIFDDE